jgi:hypothetical protein
MDGHRACVVSGLLLREARNMIVCQSCGAWAKMKVDGEPATARCLECGAEQTLRRLPLFVVTGASGTGKSAIVPHLRALLPDMDVFETDQIWDSGGDWQMIKCNWLRVAHAVAQSGRMSVLCGTILPHELRSCEHIALFSSVHWLALDCTDKEREIRLTKRPGALACTDEFIQEQHRLSRWLKENSAKAFQPPLTLIDTTTETAEQTTRLVARWVGQRTSATFG